MQSTFSAPPNDPITVHGPPCPKCSTAMWLYGLNAADQGHDHSTFECPRCQYEETMLIRRR